MFVAKVISNGNKRALKEGEGEGREERKGEIFQKGESLGAQGELSTPTLPKPEGPSRGGIVYFMCTGKRPQEV